MNLSDLNLGWRLNQTLAWLPVWADIFICGHIFLTNAGRELLGVAVAIDRWGKQFTTTWKCTCRNGSKQEEPKGKAMGMKHLLVVWLTCSVTESTECLTRLIDLILHIGCFVCWYCTDVNFFNFSSLENLCEREVVAGN